MVSVVVGSAFRDGRLGGQRYRAIRTEIHPYYKFNDFTLKYDVAVVRTISEIQFNSRVQPIEVSSFYADVGVVGTVTGWGLVRQGVILGIFADRLQKMDAITIADTDCYSMLAHDPRSQWLNEQNICTLGLRNSNTSVCQGDSGGPLGEFELRRILGFMENSEFYRKFVVLQKICCFIGKSDFFWKFYFYKKISNFKKILNFLEKINFYSKILIF